MSFPETLNPSSPAGSDSPAQGDDQFRALKQFIADVFGIATSPSSVSAAAMKINTDGTFPLPIRLTNKTGGGVILGDVGAIDADNDAAVDLADTADSLKRYVIALETIADSSAGLWAIGGIAIAKAQGTIVRGNYVQKSATTKAIEDTGTAAGVSTNVPRDAQGIALTADSGGFASVLWWGGTGGAGGVSSTQTFYVPLRIEAATLPDATGTINNPPEIVREISSGSQTSNSPKRSVTKAKFDAATDEHLMWTGIIPGNYASGGSLLLIWKAASATSGATFWKASIAVTVDSSTDDDAIVFNTVTGTSGTAPATQGQTLSTTITLTTTNMSANRLYTIFVGRDADGTLGTDDMTGDAELLSVVFSYVGTLS